MSKSQFPNLPPAVDELPPSDEQFNLLDYLKAQPPWLIGLVVVAFVATVVLGVMAFRPKSDQVTPTPDATVLAEFVAPAGDTLVLDSGVPHPQFSVPISLTVGGLTFDVLPYQIKDDGTWHYPEGQNGQAVWVYGTIVNFVIGLEHTAGNAALLESLVAGDQISMTTNTGVYSFGFAGREKVGFASTDPFDQTEPGLTLISLGADDADRWVVYCDYLGLEDGVEQAAGRSASVGEPVVLGDIRVTVLSTAYVYDDPDVPPGWAFYLVEYQLENFSQEVLDPNRFRMELQDGIGSMYALNLTASQAGTFGYLMLTIPPNTVAQGTAGYLVPTPLQGPKLSWAFSRLGSPESVAKVLIDFENPEQVVDPRLFAAVNLAGAELSGDRTLLSVWGTVLNNSDETLFVAAEDVSLLGRDATALLRSADPALPWTIEPGSVVSFRLSYQRPAGTAVTFTVLNQPFEITGLQ